MKGHRLVKVASMSAEQAAIRSYLIGTDGLCTCGRHILATDSKFILGNPAGDRIVMAAYCYDCFQVINNTLRAIKDSKKTLDPEQRRHEGLN